MATMATAHLHANRPRLEVHLVVNDEDFLGSDLVCGRELADGATARVHVRLRLGKQQLLATVLHVRDKCAALVLPIMRPELVSKQVECEKASVMPRFLVLGTGIAQTCYELVVHRYSAKSGSNRVETEPLLKTLLIACAKSGAMLICLILPLRCSSGMGIVLHTTISSATEFSRRS